jgi:hypothetical protein
MTLQAFGGFMAFDANAKGSLRDFIGKYGVFLIALNAAFLPFIS